jgi:hypothetical protein
MPCQLQCRLWPLPLRAARCARRPHAACRLSVGVLRPRPPVTPSSAFACAAAQPGAAPPISSPLGLTTARWSRPGCPLGRSMVPPTALFPRAQPNGLPPARVVQSAQRVARLSARLRSLRSPLARPCGSSRRRHRRRIFRPLHALARYGVRCYAAGRVFRENLPKLTIEVVPTPLTNVASARLGSSLCETATRGLPPYGSACFAHGRRRRPHSCRSARCARSGAAPVYQKSGPDNQHRSNPSAGCGLCPMGQLAARDDHAGL